MDIKSVTSGLRIEAPWDGSLQIIGYVYKGIQVQVQTRWQCKLNKVDHIKKVIYVTDVHEVDKFSTSLFEMP